MAFHVDYWDRLGWRDPFASKDWTVRQSDYAARWKNSSVYTPGFVLDGREWRSPSTPTAGPEAPGVLKIVVTHDVEVAATFSGAADKERALKLHVARLGSTS